MRDDVTWKRKEPLFNRQRRKKTIGRRQIRRRRRFDLVPTVPIRYTREKKEKQTRWERERERERERNIFNSSNQKKETKNGKWEKKLRKKSKTITKEKKGKPRDARWPPLPKGPHSVLPRFRFFFFHSFFLSFFLSFFAWPSLRAHCRAGPMAAGRRQGSSASRCKQRTRPEDGLSLPRRVGAPFATTPRPKIESSTLAARSWPRWLPSLYRVFQRFRLPTLFEACLQLLIKSRVWLAFTGFFLDFASFSWDLLGFNGFVLSFTRFLRVLTWFRLVLLGFLWFYWVLLGFTWFYLVLLGILLILLG